MFIISLSVGLVAPRMFGGSDTAMLESQVRDVTSAFRYAKRQAIIQGKPITATFHSTSSQNLKNERPTNGQSVSWLRRGVKLRLGHTDDAIDSNDLTVVFYPEGGSSGAELAFVYKNKKEHISISPVTGRVTIGLTEK